MTSTTWLMKTCAAGALVMALAGCSYVAKQILAPQKDETKFYLLTPAGGHAVLGTSCGRAGVRAADFTRPGARARPGQTAPVSGSTGSGDSHGAESARSLEDQSMGRVAADQFHQRDEPRSGGANGHSTDRRVPVVQHDSHRHANSDRGVPLLKRIPRGSRSSPQSGPCEIATARTSSMLRNPTCLNRQRRATLRTRRLR